MNLSITMYKVKYENENKNKKENNKIDNFFDQSSSSDSEDDTRVLEKVDRVLSRKVPSHKLDTKNNTKHTNFFGSDSDSECEKLSNLKLNSFKNIKYYLNEKLQEISANNLKYIGDIQNRMKELGKGSYGIAYFNAIDGMVYKVSNFCKQFKTIEQNGTLFIDLTNLKEPTRKNSSKMGLPKMLDIGAGTFKEKQPIIESIVYAATDPERTSSYWNKVYNYLLSEVYTDVFDKHDLNNYVKSDIILVCIDDLKGNKLPQDFIKVLRTPFIKGDEFDGNNEDHIKAKEVLIDALKKGGFEILDLYVGNNIKILNKDGKCVALPIDFDFIYTPNVPGDDSRKLSFTSEQIEKYKSNDGNDE